MSEDRIFGEALQDLRFREDLGFGTFNAVSSNQRHLRYPDFLIIGAQKAGTTWLYTNLNYHPNIWLAPTKELNYFNQVYGPSLVGWESAGRRAQAKAVSAFYDAQPVRSARQEFGRRALDVINEDAISDEWYGRIFAHAPAEDLCGEASPEYCVLPRAAVAHIAALNPVLKVILILRDPIERFWSHVRMAERDGYGESTLEFLTDDLTWRTFAGRSNYPEMIRRWRTCFGNDRLIVLNYDWIESDPQRLLRTACEGLGLRHDERFFPRASREIGAGQKAALPDGVYALAKARMRHIYDDLVDLVPEIAEPWRRLHYAPSSPELSEDAGSLSEFTDDAGA